MHHQDTRIHAKSLELIRLTARVCAALPVGHADLANQLKRAATSIALNFAEGFGRTGEKDRLRFFAIARASSNEVSMIFDVGNAFGAISDEACREGKALCDHLGGMLYKFR